MKTWIEKMNNLAETASYLSGLDVLDIAFTDGTSFDVYVAMTPQQRIRGLSGIEALDASGMMFYFDKPSYVPFTMQSMLIDLTIGWYDKSGRLLRYGNYQNGDENPLFSSSPFTYVIETPLGWLPEADLVVKERNG